MTSALTTVLVFIRSGEEEEPRSRCQHGDIGNLVEQQQEFRFLGEDNEVGGATKEIDRPKFF